MRHLLAEKTFLTPGIGGASPGLPARWYQVPYTHSTLHPNSVSGGGAITTDDLGLRHVELDGRRIGFRQFAVLPGPKGVLVGGSTAFSVGASSDGAAIASQLWRLTGKPWFHLAMVTYVSAQEWMLYALLDPREVTEVVVLSGINTLSATVLSPSTAVGEVFSPNFFLLPGRPVTGRQRAVQLLRRAAGYLLRTPIRQRDVREVGSKQLELALATMRRDLGLLRALTATRGIRLTFVAQSLLPLLAKPLSPEEQRILAIQEELGAYRPFELWGVYLTELPRMYPAYCAGLSEICRALGIRFFDLNQQQVFNTDRWLFVDTIHFTDQGSRVCAELIAQWCLERRPDVEMVA